MIKIFELIIKNINTWKLKKSKALFLYKLIKLLTKDQKIQKYDTIKCWGIGYPHWKGKTFECTLIFKDDTIGVDGKIRVSRNDFYKIKK